MLRATDLAWAAGFLEGDGAFGCWRHVSRRRLTVSAVQVQREPLERLQRYFGGSIRRSLSKKRNEQDRHIWSVSGASAAGVMMTVYAYMSPRRRGQIQAALTQWKTTTIPPKHRTHCPAKHPYQGTNLIVKKDGARACRVCHKARCRRWYASKAAA